MTDRHTFNEPLIVDTRLDYSPNGWSTRYIVSCTCGWVVKHWLSDSSEAQIDSREGHFAESVGLWEVHMVEVRGRCTCVAGAGRARMSEGLVILWCITHQCSYTVHSPGHWPCWRWMSENPSGEEADCRHDGSWYELVKVK